MVFDAEGRLLGSNAVAGQLVPRPLQAPGGTRSSRASELPGPAPGVIIWIEHARQRPEVPLQLPLWSGLRLLALALRWSFAAPPSCANSAQQPARATSANAMTTPLRTSESCC